MKYGLIIEKSYQEDDGHRGHYTTTYQALQEFNSLDELQLWKTNHPTVKIMKTIEYQEIKLKVTVHVEREPVYRAPTVPGDGRKLVPPHGNGFYISR